LESGGDEKDVTLVEPTATICPPVIPCKACSYNYEFIENPRRVQVQTATHTVAVLNQIKMANHHRRISGATLSDDTLWEVMSQTGLDDKMSEPSTRGTSPPQRQVISREARSLVHLPSPHAPGIKHGTMSNSSSASAGKSVMNTRKSIVKAPPHAKESRDPARPSTVQPPRNPLLQPRPNDTTLVKTITLWRNHVPCRQLQP
jgi:hypothetical protein